MDTRPGDQERSLVEAVALLEAGRAREALSLLDQRVPPEQGPSPAGHLLLDLALARSVRAQALADLDQGAQALACLEEALALVDLETCVMERVWRFVSALDAGAANHGAPFPGSFENLLKTFPPEASDPALLCCKAEALYAFHEFEASCALLGFACVLDARGAHPTLPRAYFANNCALASFEAGDVGLADSLSAAAVECLEAGSPLAAPLFYNRAALLWERGEKDAAARLYRRVLACAASDGRARLAQVWAAARLGVTASAFAYQAQLERMRAMQESLYGTPRVLVEDEERRIWIPTFAAWFCHRANQAF